jgi:hypothetical protein
MIRDCAGLDKEIRKSPQWHGRPRKDGSNRKQLGKVLLNTP